MSVDQLAPFVWPALFLVLAIIFREPIADLIFRTRKGKISPTGVEVEASGDIEKLGEKGEAAAETLIQVGTQVRNILHQGKPYDDSLAAFNALYKTISDAITQSIKEDENNPEITIKVLAVALTFSWSFIIGQIPKILKHYGKVKIYLDIVWVDPDYLIKVGLDEGEPNWASISRKRIEEVKNFAQTCQKDFGNQLEISAHLYRNLPHWHGWLVGEEYLFMGRSTWELDHEKPRFLVGQNKYRYFDSTDPEGKERIDLFRSWHSYYRTSTSVSVLNGRNSR